MIISRVHRHVVTIQCLRLRLWWRRWEKCGSVRNSIKKICAQTCLLPYFLYWDRPCRCDVISLAGHVRALWLNGASLACSYHWTLIGNLPQKFKHVTPTWDLGPHFFGNSSAFTQSCCATFAPHHKCCQHSATVATCWWHWSLDCLQQWGRRVSPYYYGLLLLAA